MLEETPLTYPGHFILGGLTGNEGIAISRDADAVDHVYELSDDDWYIGMTNVDVW